MAEPFLTVSHLCKSYRLPGSTLMHPLLLHAVQDVSFTLHRGESFGIVGESGCGKSTIAKLIMGLEKPDEGEIILDGHCINRLPERERRPLRPRFQMVFQDSSSSLNPRKRVEDILREPMLYHHLIDRADASRRVDELLALVGMPPEMKKRYPHELSGGQRQRVCIARALSLNPELVILDEPVSALDVSVQAQILNLLRDLQKELQLTCIFIGHGLGAVRYVSQRMAVMYMGRLVETGDAQTLFEHPVHPYTCALLDAAPSADFTQRDRPRLALTGEVGQTAPQAGCAFRLRCPYATAACETADMALRPVADHHDAACTAGRRV